MNSIDCPWILSHEDISYLDPQNVSEAGRRYPLSTFFTKDKYSSHQGCFTKHYFGYEGTANYDGTIFRFPLKTGSYTSTISNETHTPEEIKAVLFAPLMEEGEHILPFLKYINSIKIFEKRENKVSLLHSVGVSETFRSSLYKHRKEITLFAEKKRFYDTTGLFITLYPINTNEHQSVWIVLNLLGFGARSSSSTENPFYKFYTRNTLKYIPWFGIAMPICANDCSSIGGEHTWSFNWDGDNFQSILQFIQSKIQISLPIQPDATLNTNSGKYYCFLPIPKDSLFPFHLHGYFALDDNRRSLKWPSSYDRSLDAEWNKFQTEMLGSVLYATFLRLTVQCMEHPQPEKYHYKLWAGINLHERDDSLFATIQREGLRMLLNEKLMYSQVSKWIPLNEGLYPPSAIPDAASELWDNENENCCIKLLLALSQPIVELPPAIADIIARYQFLKEIVEPRMISPIEIRHILIANSTEHSLREFISNRQNAVLLLEVILSDLDTSAGNQRIATQLAGIPLIILANHAWEPQPFIATKDKTFFISEITPIFMSIFPGLEHLFADPSLPENIHSKLVQIARETELNIQDITNIDDRVFTDLLSRFFNKSFNSTMSPLSWTPGSNNQPQTSWIKSLWDFIGCNQVLLAAVGDFPLLPATPLSSIPIQLLAIRSQRFPYIEFDKSREPTAIEDILSRVGCTLCHRNSFIQCFDEFVLRPVPHCLIDLFKNESIFAQFIALLSETGSNTRKYLVELLITLPLEGEGDTDRLKRLPIFRNFRQDWLSLSTLVDQKSPILPPRTILENISYPSYILTPFDSQLVILYQKLHVSSVSEELFIQKDLVPYMVSSELYQSPQNRNLIAFWILDRLPNLQLAQGELLECLKETKWLVDSSTPHDKMGQIKLFKPASMLDPADPVLKHLIMRSNEGFFPNGIYDDHVEKMKKFFQFKTHTDLNSRLLKEVCKSAVSNLQSHQTHTEWLVSFKALLQLISHYFIQCELQDQNNFWKEFSQKFVIPQTNISKYFPLELQFTASTAFSSPSLASQVIPCTPEQLPLLAYASSFILIPHILAPENEENCLKILKCMGFQVNIPSDVVIKQLNHIISYAQQPCNDSLFSDASLYKTVSTIYEHLDPLAMHFEDLNPCFVLIKERREFVAVSLLAETTQFDMRPYVYSCSDLNYKCINLFNAMGMPSTPTVDQYCTILSGIYTQSHGQPVTQSDMKIVLNILAAIASNNLNGYTIYVPGHDDILYASDHELLVFTDEKWLNRTQMCSEYSFIFTHEGITRETAYSLGITNFYDRVVTNTEYQSADVHTPVIHRIKSIMEAYTDELGLLREMIQNSDDAGASEMKILFDFRSHSSQTDAEKASLLSHNLHHWQGPAIWFYNNKTMDNGDFEKILSVGGYGKADDVTKIGRNGVGFCSVFRVTDLPSFVSGDRLCILDPHGEYVKQTDKQNTACTINFCREKFVKCYKDQFEPYQNIFGCKMLENEFYQSTLFRIPLRPRDLKSLLSVASYNQEDAIELLQTEFMKNIEDMLLFTQNLVLIEMYKLNANIFTNAGDCMKRTFWVRKEISNGVSQSFMSRSRKNLEESLQGKATDYEKATTECSITSSSNPGQKRWLMCYSTGGRDFVDIIGTMRSQQVPIHAPFTAVAFNLEKTAKLDLQCNKSGLFSYHPLQIPLQLPYHCHGMFELSNDKMSLHYNQAKDYKTNWNSIMISLNLTNSVVTLFTNLAERFRNKSEDIDVYCQLLYNVFGKEMCVDPIWASFCTQITEEVMEESSCVFPITASDGSHWSSFSEIIVLNELDLQSNIDSRFYSDKYLQSIKEFLIGLGYKLAFIPSELYKSSGLIHLLLQNANAQRIINTTKFVEIFFNSLSNMSHSLLVELLPGLITSYSNVHGLFDLISTTPCIPCGDVMRIPSMVIDPNNIMLSDMYEPEENRFPASFCHESLFNPDSSCYAVLKRTFKLVHDKLPLKDLLERVNKITEEVDFELANKLLVYLNQSAFSNQEIEELRSNLSSQPFLPTLSAAVYPMVIAQQPTLTPPKQATLYSLRYFLGLQQPILSEDTCQHEKALRILNISPTSIGAIETDAILDEIIASRVSYESLRKSPEDLLTKMVNIYKELARRMDNEGEHITETIIKECVYVPEFGFVSTENVIISQDRSFSPYIHTLQQFYSIKDTKLKRFFSEIKINKTLTQDQCYGVLSELSLKCGTEQTCLDSSDEAIAIKIIEEFAKFQDIYDAFLLGEDGFIHKSLKCVFYDLKWKEKGDYQREVKINGEPYFFVHPQIPNPTASKLGAISLSSSIKVVSKKFKFKYASKGQRESLVKRLKDIVNRYEATEEVFKELLQNSDDAKAKTVKFLFDYSCHNSESLINEKMELCQGPSLYVYNDKTFSNDDFKNILEIAGETKKDDTTKIGRFGLGFNTVYHLTDIPSFVSRNFIHILDPHYFSDEPGLSIDYTENGAILQECYSDQFSVYNIFDCNVFSSHPYDGTLFRFPFRTSKYETQINPAGIFDSATKIENLQKSFLAMIEQVIFFLQHVENIEVYERREIGGEIKQICKVNKTFKIKPYSSSFLIEHKEHFEQLNQGDHVTAIEVIEIEKDLSGEKSREEYILSHASGTGECVEVIREFKELREASVLPISSVAIPRRVLVDLEGSQAQRSKKEEYKLFCFLPIPQKSPYNMHINGYFHLNAYRTELHVTDSNGHLTQWNISLINDALPNALITLLMKISSEITSDTSDGSLTDKQLEKYYSFWPLSSSGSEPWTKYPERTAKKILNSNAPLFPCTLHSRKWLTFQDSSFLNVHSISKDFINFIHKLAAQKGVYLVDMPSNLISKPFFKTLFKDAINTYDFKRLCVELLFPRLEEIKNESLDDLKLVVTNLFNLFSNDEKFLSGSGTEKSPLCQLEFIPCGDINPVLRKPCEVIHPESRFSSIYYPDDQRLPHKDFNELFSSTQYLLVRIGVLKEHLPEEDLIDRCEVAQIIYSENAEEGKKHAMVLLKYLNDLTSEIPDSIRSLPFIPVWRDPLFTHLGCAEERLVAPQQCFSYYCRHVITHKYFAVEKDVNGLTQALISLKIESRVEDPEMLLELLEVMSSKQDEIKDYEDSDKEFDDRIKKVFRWLADYCFPKPDLEKFVSEKKDFPIEEKQKHIKDSLQNKPWIWHPPYKEFYPISMVRMTSDFLRFNSKYLISFPYPDMIPNDSKCNVSYFFKFMGMNQSLDYKEALEILNTMRIGYEGEVLDENDFTLAVRLINEIIGEHYVNDRTETQPEDATLISEDKCLHPAHDLFRNDIEWMESSFLEEDRQDLVHHSIPPIVSHRLGAKSKRSTYFEDESIDGIEMEDFGPNEDIKDRIENIKSQINCDVTILNELLQNAEDAKATEIAFILDFKKYPSKHLCFPSDTHKRWQSLQSTPSLLVYNNQPFTERDIEGIQKVGIGGKRSLQTIGRFGIGFNSVYHLTRSPCLLTSTAGVDSSTLCIFDPYREYLNIPNKYQLPGKKIIIRDDKRGVFKDQLEPYDIAPITQNEEFRHTLTNLRNKSSYSLFRLPLTAKKSDIIIATENILYDFLNHARRILIFLKHIKRIDVLSIDKDGKVFPKLSLRSESCVHSNIPQTIRSFGPNQYLRDVSVTLKKLSSKTWIISKPNPSRPTNEVRSPDTSHQREESGNEKIKLKEEENEWLCYNHEGPVESFPDHEKFKDKIETEKLRKMFGNLALDISKISKGTKRFLSYIFCYLPIGTSFNFPIHINAPLIVDPHRQFLKFSESSWQYDWHVAVIENVLVPLFCKLLTDLSDISLLDTNVKAEVYYKWFYSLFPKISFPESNSNASFMQMISRGVYNLLHQSGVCILANNDMDCESLHPFVGENQGIFKIFPGNEQLDKLYSILNKIRYPLTCAPDTISTNLKSLDLEYQTLEPIHLAEFLVCNKDSLVRDSEFPCELQNSVLHYEEVVLLLKYVLLEGNREQLKTITGLPLKIDSDQILSSFMPHDDTFLSRYSTLLPQCSSHFIHTEFPIRLVKILEELSFLKPLDANFLAENLEVDESFTKDSCLLFWQFAIKECKGIDQIMELFGDFILVPVCHRGEVENSKSFYKYSISALSSIASEELYNA